MVVEVEGVVQNAAGATEVSFNCVRLLNAQFKAVNMSTDVVVLTIGGNDAGFPDIVESCFTFWLVSKSACQSNVLTAQGLISEIQESTKNILSKLHDRMGPDGRVALLSYPYLELGGYTFRGYSAGDEVRLLGDSGDAAAAAAVAQVNAAKGYEFAFFVDTVKAKFAGHEPNGSPWHRNPDRWLHEFEGNPLTQRAEWYHPNPLGHQAYADVLKPHGVFAPSLPPAPKKAHVDLLFVVDTSASMGVDLVALQEAADEFVDQLADGTRSYRIGLASFRDHPSLSGNTDDYMASVDYWLAENGSGFVGAVSGLTASSGGGSPDAVFSGLVVGVDQEWRRTVRRAVVLIGDSPPHNPEPVSGYTADDAVDAVMQVGGAGVYVVDVSSDGAVAGSLASLANRTGGGVYSAPLPSTVSGSLTDVLDDILCVAFCLGGRFLLGGDGR